MNKITVITILPGDQKFDWNKQEYEPGKERLAYGKPVEITDEEIDPEPNMHYLDSKADDINSYCEGWYDCWKYIKSRINPQQ